MPPPEVLETQATQPVKVTGVNFGREELSSPPSGASIIHSTELPLKVAGEGRFGAAGGARVMLKCALLVLLAITMFPAVVPW